jgi:large subunit ribosomal protein L6
MSRIGRKPIEIPASVKVEIKDQDLKVLGPLGGLARKVDPSLCIEFKDGKILISPKEK